MPAPDSLRLKRADDTPVAPRGVRRRSDYVYLGLPLWCIAVGPDPARGEMRGHAKCAATRKACSRWATW